jgi:hypothetical protein
MSHGVGIPVHAHSVLASDRDPELEGVDGIQAEPVAEERRCAIDLLDSDVFDSDLDQQVLEPCSGHSFEKNLLWRAIPRPMTGTAP